MKKQNTIHGKDAETSREYLMTVMKTKLALVISRPLLQAL